MPLPDNTRFYVIDTETTGVDENAKACEIGFIELDEDFNILFERESIVDPEQAINPSASGVHGLTWGDCKPFPTIKEFFSEDDASCLGHKLAGPAVIIGHRVAFDKRFFGPYIEGEPLEVCTLRWTRKLYPTAENHQLSTLIFSLDLPRSTGAHRALADCYTAMHLARHICERTDMNLRQLADASSEPMLVETVPFGKWKGTKFSDVPRSYLAWMRREMKDLDQDLQHTIDTLLSQK